MYHSHAAKPETCTHVFRRVCVCTCVRVCVCVYVFMCVCVLTCAFKFLIGSLAIMIMFMCLFDFYVNAKYYLLLALLCISTIIYH